MKNYNKILEAVNRGILLALDDFDDQEIGNLKIGLVEDKTHTKDTIWILENFVNLGLPSGTLWAKYNLGCDWDKLNNDPEHNIHADWFGNYYAWGEINPKEYYDWEHYKLLDNYHKEGVIGHIYDKGELSKYVTHPYGDLMDSQMIGKFNDDKTQLELEDDAAYLYDKRFRIPTKELCDELIKYTTLRWISNSPIKGLVNGVLFISKINGNEMFLPAAGIKFVNTKEKPVQGGIGTYALIWSSSLYDKKPDCAYLLTCSSSSNGNLERIFTNYSLRFYGLPIRPVLNL